MSDEKWNKKFGDWNPMVNDYKNAKFNQYETGPGANLDEEHQPGWQASEGGKHFRKNPTLVFKNIPQGMTKNALGNICSRHGRVLDVRDSNKCTYLFVSLQTVADLEAVFSALQKNDYGFEVILGKSNTKETMTAIDKSRLGIQAEPPVPVPPKQTEKIDYENRRFCTSSKKLPRPIVQEDNKLINEVSDPALKLLANDVHSLERQGLYKMQNKGNFSYSNGRSYVNMPEATKKYIEEKHAISSGVYNKQDQKFKHSDEGLEKPNNIGQCLHCGQNCDNVCSRCSQYYCSTDCQLKDWKLHRYICGKPKHLQKKPQTPTKTEISIQKVEKSTKNFIESKNRPVSKSEQVLRQCDKKNLSCNNTNSESKPVSSITSKVNSSDTDKEKFKQNMPRSGNIVAITAITKTNLVFIRSKSYDGNLSYFDTINTLQAIGKNLKPLKDIPKCGSVVIAKFEEQYNRALVLNAQSLNKIVIHFMDYGNLDQKKLQELYEAPIEFINKPRHAIPVNLKDVPEMYMTQEIRDFMYTYLNNINVEIRYKPEDFRVESQIYAVELIDENTQQNLNKTIIKLATPKEPQNSDEYCMRGYLEHKRLPSGENVELLVMDNSVLNSGCISCTTKPYAIEIQKYQKELQDYANSIQAAAYTPRMNEFCIARYSEDGLWYRGCCLETVGDGHPSIHFIDYGNIDTVPIEDIRRYPRQFTFPIYTADCEIQGVPESCNEKIVAKLEQLIPNGKTIKCSSVKAFEEDNFYSLYLPNVVKELTDMGLI